MWRNIVLGLSVCSLGSNIILIICLFLNTLNCEALIYQKKSWKHYLTASMGAYSTECVISIILASFKRSESGDWRGE